MAVALFAIPHFAFAAPAAVEGISAREHNGNAMVEWEPVDTAQYYRVYFSSQSILENNGIYDDFLETDGPVATLEIDSALLSNKVFVAVLAVDAEGMESSVFLEEDSVLLEKQALSADGVEITATEPKSSSAASASSSANTTNTLVVTGPTTQRESGQNQTSSTATQTETSAEVPVWQQPENDGKLHVLLAEATSPTEVLLRFNAFPIIQPEVAPQAFSIVDANGKSLRIRSIYIQEEFISVQTMPQVRNAMYQVVLSEPLASTTGMPLDAENRIAVFAGHADGIVAPQYTNTVVASSASSSSAEEYRPTLPKPTCLAKDIAVPPRITNMRLRSTQEEGNTHTVQVEWNIDTKNCDAQLRYIVRQSRDRGRTFGPPQVLPIDIAGLHIPGTQPGEYGVGISTINSSGYVSQEVFQTIMLPGDMPTPVVTTPTPLKPAAIPATVQVPQTTTLPSSGAGLLGGGALSLGAAWHIKRRRKKSHS